MEFGRVEESSLDTIDFTLPMDAPETMRILKANKGEQKPKVFVGCAKWGRKDWIGKLYTKGTKEKDFLQEYARHFNCIEFNAIYYRLPEKKQIHDWKSKVGEDFLFCPKFTDVITHIRRLKNAEADTDKFLEVIHEFGNNLGPVFLMPHPQMGIKHLETLKSFLEYLPRDLDVFIELRHLEWSKEGNAAELYKYCESLKVGTVLTDTAGRRDMMHMQLSRPDAFIRFVGNSLHATDYKRIDDWVQRIKQWIKEGIHNIYFFMHQHDELYSPELIKYLIDELNKHCNLDLQAPKLLNE